MYDCVAVRDSPLSRARQETPRLRPMTFVLLAFWNGEIRRVLRNESAERLRKLQGDDSLMPEDRARKMRNYTKVLLPPNRPIFLSFSDVCATLGLQIVRRDRTVRKSVLERTVRTKQRYYLSRSLHSDRRN